MTTKEDQLKNKSNFESDGKLYLVCCVDCGRENYALAVAQSACAWCGWCEDKKENEE